jgi:hypothetical protein
LRRVLAERVERRGDEPGHCPAYAALVSATSVAVLRHGLLPRALWLGSPLAAALAFAGFLGGALVVSSLL